MAKICLVLFILLFEFQSSALGVEITEKQIRQYFEEVEELGVNSKNIWGISLSGPTILVEPNTRHAYTNYSDSKNTFVKSGSFYSGILPKHLNIANTTINYAGIDWSMVMLPLSNNKSERVNLIAHESFHRIQSTLGFEMSNPSNAHLDENDARIYLRLELEALKKALLATKEKDIHNYLTHAFSFREYRQNKYPKLSKGENLLELNEGLAEYTGLIASGRDQPGMTKHLISSINHFIMNPSYVRSFAYVTIPVYGYLLSSKDSQWNRRVNAETNLTKLFAKHFSIKVINESIDNLGLGYGLKEIQQEEKARSQKIAGTRFLYLRQFVLSPHLELPLAQMNISFDLTNLFVLKEFGTVYPTMRVTDRWGILTVENGGLMSEDWSKIILSLPTKLTDNKLIGDGWQLEINPGYQLEVDKKSNQHRIIKIE